MSVATSDIWEAMSTAQNGGEQVLRDAVAVPGDWMIAGHIVVGWPKGRHGPLRRRPLAEVVNLDHWDQPYRQQEKRRP